MSLILTKITRERAAQLEQESQGVLSFTFSDNNVSGLGVHTPAGSVFVRYESYELIVQEPLRKKTYCLQWQSEEFGETILRDREFESVCDRMQFIERYLDGKTEDELLLWEEEREAKE